jgi:predicted O-methyltransferase YrrM
MNLKDLKSDIEKKMRLQTISSNILLSKCRLIDEISRKSGQYQDPSYLPLYYHLSKFIHPKSIMQIGLYLGLPLCCFLQGAKDVERILCFQHKEEKFYSGNLAFSNIRDILKKIKPMYHYGSIFDNEFQKYASLGWDLLFINQENTDNDEMNNILDICWNNANLDSFIVVDRVKSDDSIKKSFENFCKINNREPIIINTRYGTGIIQK